MLRFVLVNFGRGCGLQKCEMLTSYLGDWASKDGT